MLPAIEHGFGPGFGPGVGNAALWLALTVALVLGVLPLAGAALGRIAWMRWAPRLSYALCALVACAYACLTAAFIGHDFSVQYVALHSNSALPLPYRIAAVWGGHEGSLLLWLQMLCLWLVVVARFSPQLPLVFLARVLAVMGLVGVGFLGFILLTSNPFARLAQVPIDGLDLNPLLQDLGMVTHPPLLYMGYVGFSVAFAFAVAALLGGRIDTHWARWTRPWTQLAWVFLTLGIAMGSSWAYYELGWGGWWFWDPVENASLMPWLLGTALMHSLAVTEKRNSFKSWTLLLALMTFAFSLLGTFLVRSGVLSSVHAFASDPQRGLFILWFLILVVGGSLVLYAWRAPRVGLGAWFALFSKESLLLANNVLLLAAAAAVLLGTLYPLILDAMGLGKVSVGAPYFETVWMPLMAPLVFLMGLGPLAHWKQAHLLPLARRLRWAGGVTLAASLLTGWLSGDIRWLASLGLMMAFWITSAVLADLLERIHPEGSTWSAMPRRLRLLPRAIVGMMLAHLGVGVFCFGVVMAKTYSVERDVQMHPGDSTTVRGYAFTFVGTSRVIGPNYRAVQGQIDVHQGGRKVTTLHPQKREYRIQQTPMTEAAIDAGLSRDLYVALGEPTASGAWIVRVYVKPFIDWIWGGCGLMALGGLLCATDRRYRLKPLPQSGTGPAP
jgi:cytochrome c-type biogenesis protein CcmF